jgi:hypothetical protein
MHYIDDDDDNNSNANEVDLLSQIATGNNYL